MKSDPNILDLMVENIYSPTYPLIASQITEKFQINKGICIDVGTGPAPLSIALAKITDLKIYAMDISEEMCQIAEQKINSECLENRIIPIRSNVNKMPFEDGFADLVVSRGSMFFWKDLSSGFEEIYRVLKPSGASYIGGGYGSGMLKEKIKREFKDNRNSGKKLYKSPPKIDINTLEKAVNNAGIKNYILINDDSGLWVLFKKQDNIT